MKPQTFPNVASTLRGLHVVCLLALHMPLHRLLNNVLDHADTESDRCNADFTEFGFARDMPLHYRLEHELGRGANGVVMAVRHIASDALFACKVVPKMPHNDATADPAKARAHCDALRREIAAMRALQSCLNVARLEDTFEDAENVYIVQELCTGGELVHALGQRHYSERTVRTCSLWEQMLLPSQPSKVLHDDMCMATAVSCCVQRTACSCAAVPPQAAPLSLVALATAQSPRKCLQLAATTGTVLRMLAQCVTVERSPPCPPLIATSSVPAGRVLHACGAEDRRAVPRGRPPASRRQARQLHAAQRGGGRARQGDRLWPRGAVEQRGGRGRRGHAGHAVVRVSLVCLQAMSFSLVCLQALTWCEGP